MGWMHALEARARNNFYRANRLKSKRTQIIHGVSMPGKRIPPTNVATATEDAERLLKQIDAMLEDERFERKRAFLESVRGVIAERGICTPGQVEQVENVRAYVERQHR